MNRLGMMIDVSHVSDPTFWDIVNNDGAGDRDTFCVSSDCGRAAKSN